MQDKQCKTSKNVYIKIDFLKLGEINEKLEKFTAEIKVEAKWYEINSSGMQTMDPLVSWNPQLYVQNVLDGYREKVEYNVVNESSYLVITETKFINGIFLI